MDSAVSLKELRHQIERRPFRPFRIYTSDGREQVITRPDLVFLTRDTLIVGVLEHDDGVPDAIYLDTLHITRVEPLPQEPPPA
jgi:hypothetical protein